MLLREGALTIVEQCLDIRKGEQTLVLNDGNDQELIEALLEVLEDKKLDYRLLEYPEPEEHGSEPPGNVAEAMKECDVFIAPTRKSISHTSARKSANEVGVRGATLPGINREIWETSLQADYSRVKEISERVYSELKETKKVSVSSPSGTDLSFEVEIDYFETDTGIMHEKGSFGNLPAGEADGATVNAEGVLVVDHLPFVDGGEGVKLHIRDNKVVDIEGEPGNPLQEKFDAVSCSRNVAEFGFGTNPGASLIGNILQDEKVLGTVHIAIGDNSSYVPEEDNRRVTCPLHWDMVCKDPMVKFDDKVMLDAGEPVFLDQ